jgi:hypothetical protein
MGFGLGPAIQRVGEVVLRLLLSKKGGIRKNFDYSVLLARILAYPGVGY